MQRPSLQELERALAIVAYGVLKYGDQFAPILDRLEREVEAARASSPTDRARRILEAYRADGDLKAICSSQP